MRLRPLLLFVPLLPSLAFAAEPARDAPAVPAPPAVRHGGSTVAEPPEDAIEPEVTITTRGTEIHEEYRVNGQLYKIKVIPAKGKPYYLVYDEPGKVRRSDIEPATIIPQWVIKRF